MVRSSLLTLCVFASSLAVTAQPASFEPVGTGGGGALFLPSVSPHNAEEIYISCDMSEMFHSTSFGRSWDIVDFRQLQAGNRSSRIEFTSDPQRLFSISMASDRSVPVASSDGGATWKPLPTDPTEAGAFSIFSDPSAMGSILLTSYTQLFYSSDGGASFGLRFTDTSGAGCHVAGVFFDGSTIYAGTNNGMLRSTDGGATFANLGTPGVPVDERIVSFAGGRDLSGTRFIAVTLGSGDVYPGVTGAEHPNFRNVYTFDPVEGSWQARGSGIPANVNPFFAAMAGSQSRSVCYVAGGSDEGHPTVYKSIDGGVTWTNMFLTPNNQNIATGWSGTGGDRDWTYGEYALGFAVSSRDASRLVITDLGFPHVSTDGGMNWNQAYVEYTTQNIPGAPVPRGKMYRGIGLENTTAWRVAWADSSTMIGCFSDIRGIRSTDAGATWGQGYSGHTLNSMYYALRHPATGLLYAATSSVHDMYQSTYLEDARIDGGSGQVLTSIDKGKSWQVYHDFKHPVIWLAADPVDSNRLYASVVHSTQGGIYLLNHVQTQIIATRLAAPPRTEGHPFNIIVLNDGSLLCSYSGRRRNNVFTPSSGVFLSTDKGATWLDRSAPQLRYWTKDVVVDPHDPAQNTWYAGVFSGWGGGANDLGGLYRTTDRGVSWTKILALEHVTSCTVNPTDANQMYVTTETDGLWITKNLREPNPAFTVVEGYHFKQPERVFFNPYRNEELWVTSFGNGLRRGSTAAGSLMAPRLVLPANGAQLASIPDSLRWEPVNGAWVYQGHWSTAPDSLGVFVWTEKGTSTGAAKKSVDPGSTIYWRVRAVDSLGNASPWSDTWSFRVSAPSSVGTRGSTSTTHFSIVSNPTKSSIIAVVRLDRPAPCSIEVVDILGNIVATGTLGNLGSGEHRVDLGSGTIATGVYLGRLTVGGRHTTTRFVVQ